MSLRNFTPPFLQVEVADNILNEIFLITKQLEIKTLLSLGTCLGFVRDGGYIEGDWDLDLIVIYKWEERDFLIDALKANDFALMRIKTDRKHIHLKKNRTAVDIWFRAGSEKFYSSFDSVVYKGKKYPVPHPVEEYLAACYTNWKVKETQMTKYWD